METTPRRTHTAEWALITGAAGRLGSQLARLAAAQGYGLILCGSLADPLQRLARELAPVCDERLLVLPVDLATLNGAELLLQDLRERGLPVRILCHCAALRPGGLFLDQDPTQLQEFLQLHLLAVALLCRGLGPGLLDHNGKVLLLPPATSDPEANAVLARATADWLQCFARELERELSPAGVRVCCFQAPPDRLDQDPAGMARAAWQALHGPGAPAPADTGGWLARLLKRLRSR
jgi:short-subunit dehydrogenase